MQWDRRLHLAEPRQIHTDLPAGMQMLALVKVLSAKRIRQHILNSGHVRNVHMRVEKRRPRGQTLHRMFQRTCSGEELARGPFGWCVVTEGVQAPLTVRGQKANACHKQRNLCEQLIRCDVTLCIWAHVPCSRHISDTELQGKPKCTGLGVGIMQREPSPDSHTVTRGTCIRCCLARG